jgi:hypothetical protein
MAEFNAPTKLIVAFTGGEKRAGKKMLFVGNVSGILNNIPYTDFVI